LGSGGEEGHGARAQIPKLVFFLVDGVHVDGGYVWSVVLEAGRAILEELGEW
jgi:hypothetical protein